MKQPNYDELLKEGLIRYKEQEFAHIPPEDEIDHVFSPKYLKAKEKLLKSLDKPYRRFTDTAAKRIAIVAACLILALSSLLAVGAVREKVVEFFYSVFDKYTTVDFLENDINNKKEIETNYIFTRIPKDYIAKDYIVNPALTYLSWENSDSQWLVFEQKLLRSESFVNTEDTQIVEKVVNDTPCISFEQSGSYVYYWEFDGYGFMLTYPIDLGEEFAASVIGNLVKIDQTAQ